MQWIGFTSAALALLSATVFELTATQQAAVIAVITAVLGIVGALSVAREKAAPLVAGFVQSVLSLALAFGAHISNETQAAVMSFVAAGVALYLRTQVTVTEPVLPQGDSL